MTEALTAAADLTILSDDLSSTELAAMVGLAPDKSWQAGDAQSQYVRRAQPHNGISYGSLLPDSATSSEHLAALLTRLAPYEQQIASTAAQPSIVDVTVWLVVRSDSDMTDIALSSAEMNAIAAMGATLVASSYFSSADQGE